MKRKLQVIVSSTFLLIAFLSGCTSETFKKNISDGDEKIKSQQYGEAFQSYKKAIDEEPNNKVAETKVEEAKSKYIEEVKSLNLHITASSAISEQMIGTYSEIWMKAIQGGIHLEEFTTILNTTTSEINPIIRESHGVGLLEHNEFSDISDFNQALSITNKFFGKKGYTESLKSSRTAIQDSVKKLVFPPQEYQSIYDEVFKLYNSYEKHVELAIQPSGSLTSFSNNAQLFASDIDSGIKSVNAKLPK